MPESNWKYNSTVRRWYWHKDDGKTLIAGSSGHDPLTYWFSVYHEGEEIAQGEVLDSIEEAQKAAEAA